MFGSYITIWKNAPFIRFLLPLMMGIILQWHFRLAVQHLWIVFVLSLFLLCPSFLLPSSYRYKFSIMNGVAVIIMFFTLGSLFVYYKDIRHDHAWYGNYYKTGDLVLVTFLEPPVEKANSYKALATVTALKEDNRFISSKGNVILYFKKDSTLLPLGYGFQIIFKKKLEEIKSTGNPGGFDYKRYNLFQGITHQVFLGKGDFVVLNRNKQGFFRKILFSIRRKVLSIIRKNIKGNKEQGLAEALLIGYKDDLDKNLVQSYTNTGVVHVIAISGLHLGLIYWLMVRLCKPLKKVKAIKWLVPVIILAGLWLFSLLAGGQPSVLRSAVMFTCIVLAENFSRKASICNTLAFSAFVLLCVNPYWIWDVGFQLSYAAVASIVIFMKPIYNWFYIKNKILDFIWKLNAVSIAAQLLTTPFSIYHFHQFPDYFLLTNFVAVPLSGIIVLGEILLCVISPVAFLAVLSGKILSWLIWLMNSYIERIESLPYSLWSAMQISIVQASLLAFIVAGIGYWLLEKQRIGAWVGIFALLFFVSLRSRSFYQANRQQKLIIYNVPRRQAIDVIDGRNCFFIGDKILLSDDFGINFYIRPSRILYRVRPTDRLSDFSLQQNSFQFHSKKFLLINKNSVLNRAISKIPIDFLVISQNPKLSLLNLSKTFDIKQVIFDGSANAGKIKFWIRDCDSLRIPYYNVSEKGAFVINLN